MPDRPLTIWCDLALSEPARARLAGGLGPHRLLRAGPVGEAVPADADVAFGQPDARRCAELERLSWVHLSSAGYTAFDPPEVRAALSQRGAALTTSSSVFSEPCAQHLLAFMLADARQLPRSLRHQLGDHAWTSHETRASSYLLRGQTVVLAGFGAIARRLVALLAPFELDLVGLRRQPRGDEPVPTFPLGDADGWLGRADHVVNLLPAGPATSRFFSAARFDLVRPGAAFYNIGRGATVDLSALADALAAGRLRSAYLDVTDPEPLPPDHPLWSARTCVITPHSAGGHADEQERLVSHFLDNLGRTGSGLPLADRII